MTRTNEFDQPVGDPVEWAGAEPPDRNPLEGRTVRLEPLSGDHADGLAALGRHPELWTYQSDEPPADAAQAARTIAEAAPRTDAITFAIVPVRSGEVEGRASYLRIQPEVGSIEVGGIVLGPALQRTRAATEAQYLLMRHAFEDLGYRRYEWKCDSLNQPSRDAALRLGFTEEGTWRHALVVKGRNRDTTWFSVTDAEWPVVGRALATWLAEDNFDESGAQRRALGDVRRTLGT